jgi:PAS domain S-box-containing protein
MRPGESRQEEPLPGIEEAFAVLSQLGTGVSGVARRSSLQGPPQKDLHIAEARYRALVEQIPAVTFMASLEGGLDEVYVSPQIQTLLGFSQEEWMSNPVIWFRQLHPDDRDLWNREFARGCMSGGPFRAECRFIARDGKVVWVHGEARLVRDSEGRPVLLQGVAFDITESKRAEAIVKESLREKELLLKEIHHRVKNNLQITSSLLRLQSSRIAQPDAKEALRESQDRVHSMALVHEMLYRTPNLARVEFADYARRLVIELFRSYSVEGRRIRHSVEMDRTLLGVDLAVPCGLILNELVSNALKHAFPDDRTGHIGIRLETKEGRCFLTVRDDGVGFPPDLDFGTADTLGLHLVRMLSHQIDGSIELLRAAGTEFVLVFPRGAEVP